MWILQSVKSFSMKEETALLTTCKYQSKQPWPLLAYTYIHIYALVSKSKWFICCLSFSLYNEVKWISLGLKFCCDFYWQLWKRGVAKNVHHVGCDREYIQQSFKFSAVRAPEVVLLYSKCYKLNLHQPSLEPTHSTFPSIIGQPLRLTLATQPHFNCLGL